MKNHLKLLIILLSYISIYNKVHAQTSNEKVFVKINGQVIDSQDKFNLFTLMIINSRTNTGIMGDPSGEFNIFLYKSDTLLISASGYKIKKICLKDSLLKKEYFMAIELEKKAFTPKATAMIPQRNLDLVKQKTDTTDMKNRIIYLKPVSVFALKGIDEINQEIAKIGVRKTDTYKNFTGLESPISYLYEAFSKIERSKRTVAGFENEDYKKTVLKHLFRVYIQADIINLNQNEFDDFISYCNLSDEFIKNASSFELVSAIKERYDFFSRMKIKKD